jgi:hypothetical protein
MPVPPPPPAVVAPAPVTAPSAPAIGASLAWIRSQGIPARADAEYFRTRYGEGEEGQGRVIAVHVGFGRLSEILLNSAHPYWPDPEFAAGFYRERWLGSPDPLHVAYHEVGHARHDRARTASRRTGTNRSPKGARRSHCA